MYLPLACPYSRTLRIQDKGRFTTTPVKINRANGQGLSHSERMKKFNETQRPKTAEMLSASTLGDFARSNFAHSKVCMFCKRPNGISRLSGLEEGKGGQLLGGSFRGGKASP